MIKNSIIKFPDLENIGIAVGIVQQYCIQVEIKVFPVCDPPFWIADVRLHYTIWETAQQIFSSSKYMFIPFGIVQQRCLQVDI